MLSSSILVIWRQQMTHWKSPWCLEKLRTEGEVGIRGWDGWMASPMQWTWTWANSRRWWRTGRPGVLQSTGSWRVAHDSVTEQQPRCRTVAHIPVFDSKSVVVALDFVIFHSCSEDQALHFLDQCFSVLVVFQLCSMGPLSPLSCLRRG